MKFDDLISTLLFEKKDEPAEASVPFVIEITKDLEQSNLYNELGELIIKLSSLRNKLTK